MSSGFISEAEIAEQKRVRQEEWDKVRTTDQPAEVPEEKYDPRSLFDRLQDQKSKRDIEYEEAHKLKNMIKGLDDDEVEFLDLVDRTKLEEERKKHMEEEKEMKDFKARVASLQEKSLDERLKQELKKPQSTSKIVSGGSSRNSQHKLLAGVVVKKPEKSTTGESKGTKRKLSEPGHSEEPDVKKDNSSSQDRVGEPEAEASVATEAKATSIVPQSALKCIGILPGLGSYENSSDSVSSSDSDDDHCARAKYDLFGAKLITIKPKAGIIKSLR